MKKNLFFGLTAVALSLFVACSSDESNESDNRTWESGSIVGEWVFEHNEVFEAGVLVETNWATDPADKCVAIFNADGTFRYYDFPPESYYDGIYTFDEQSGRMIMDGDGITVAFSGDTMRWTYDEEEGYLTVEYYVKK